MKPKIVFAPGCFDDLDMDQAELDEFVKMIQAKVEDGSLFEESRELDPNDPEDSETLDFVESKLRQASDRKAH